MMEDGNWKAAENIKVGDRITTASGEVKVVEDVSVLEYGEGVKIYNLNVDDYHTYFVGSSELLVHNDCSQPMSSAYDKVVKAAKAKGIKNKNRLVEIGESAAKAVAELVTKIIDDAKAIGLKSESLLNRISGNITEAVADGKKLTAPTKPKGGVPDGVLKESTERGIIKENETAELLADEGYDIKLLEEVDGGNGWGIPGQPSNPDYLIDGKAFDCYAPMPTSSFKTITKKLYDKTKQQSSRIILNLDDFPKESLDDLVSTILNKTSEAGDLKRLEELKIIIDGKIADIFLR